MRAAPDLTHLFSPRAIAIIGASDDVKRIGGQPMHAITEFGYRGAVYPVNPKYHEVKGLRCYAEVGSVPRPCDVAVIVLPADIVPAVIEQCGDAGIPFAVVLSAGFTEVGNETLQTQLAHAIKKSGVRVIGPNCTGLFNLKDRVFNGFGAGFRNPHLKPGPRAMVSQSGGFGYSIVAYAEDEGVGFNYMVSTGNETDLTSLDVIGHLMEQPDVEMIVSYMEGIGDGRQLRRLGKRALELSKPIVIWKVGNTQAGAKAALSHTANLTARYELYRAAFQAGGFIEITDMDQLVDIARVFRAHRLPAGNRVIVLTTSGGAGVLLADRCIEQGLELPKPHSHTETELRKLTPTFAALENPVDLSATLAQHPAGFNSATAIVLSDPNIDLAIIRSFPGRDVAIWAHGLARITAATAKPVLVSLSGLVDKSSELIKVLEGSAIPYFATPGRAAGAAGALHSFAAKLRRDRDTASDDACRSGMLQFPSGAKVLSEREAKAYLAEYGIPVVREVAVPLSQIASLPKLPISFPTVVKIDSRDIPHKTEAGAVRVGMRDLEQVKRAAQEVVAAARKFNSGAAIDGVLVQEMAVGIELLVGSVNDPIFGPYVVLGMGGIFAEVIRDKTLRYAPFGAAVVHDMIEELKGARILRGFRGSAPCDLEALAQTVSRLSWLVYDHADRISEVDINPLFVRQAGAGVVAADGLIALKAATPPPQ